MQPLVCHRIGWHGSTHAQGDGIRLPVGNERHDAGEHERDNGTHRAVAHQNTHGHSNQHEYQHETEHQRHRAALVGGDEIVQNFTDGGVAAAASASKYSRSAKLKPRAKITPGNDCVVLL